MQTRGNIYTPDLAKSAQIFVVVNIEETLYLVKTTRVLLRQLVLPIKVNRFISTLALSPTSQMLFVSWVQFVLAPNLWLFSLLYFMIKLHIQSNQ